MTEDSREVLLPRLDASQQLDPLFTQPSLSLAWQHLVSLGGLPGLLNLLNVDLATSHQHLHEPLDPVAQQARLRRSHFSLRHCWREFRRLMTARFACYFTVLLLLLLMLRLLEGQPVRGLLLGLLAFTLWNAVRVVRHSSAQLGSEMRLMSFRVKRKGVCQEIMMEDLRIGDMVWVGSGSVLPFDGILMHS
jgi:hypothetical protein